MLRESRMYMVVTGNFKHTNKRCTYICSHVIGYIKGLAWIFKVSCHQLEEFITKLGKNINSCPICLTLIFGHIKNAKDLSESALSFINNYKIIRCHYVYNLIVSHFVNNHDFLYDLP